MIVTPVICQPSVITHAAVCAAETIYQDHIQAYWTDGFTFWSEAKEWTAGGEFCPEVFYTGIWGNQGIAWRQVEVPWNLWLTDLQGDGCG